MNLRQFSRRTVLNRVEHMRLRRWRESLATRMVEDRTALKRIDRAMRLPVKPDKWEERPVPPGLRALAARLGQAGTMRQPPPSTP